MWTFRSEMPELMLSLHSLHSYPISKVKKHFLDCSTKKYLSLNFDLSHESNQCDWLRIWIKSTLWRKNVELSIFKNSGPAGTNLVFTQH